MTSPVSTSLDRTAVKVGQLWKENDPRMNRTVKVTAIHHGLHNVRVDIQRVNEDGSPWTSTRYGGLVVSAPRTSTEMRRFGLTGRAGFTLFKDAG